MLIDVHTHAFPDKLAPNVIPKLSYCAGGLRPQTAGTVSSLKAEMHNDGVDMAIVQCIATNARQQTNVNNFAIEINNDPQLFAFGSVHPDAPNVFEELERIKAAGLKGVKLHPEYQGFYVDDERMKPIYKKIASLGLVTLFHAGQDYGCPPPYHGMPEHFLRALQWFDSPVIAAHWGGMGCCADVLDKLCGTDLWFDTSFGYGCTPRSIAQLIVEKQTPDRLLFASDMPWHRPRWELRFINTLDLSDTDKEKIFYRNAQSLLGI